MRLPILDYWTSQEFPGHAMTVQRRDIEGEYWPRYVVVCGCGHDSAPLGDYGYTQAAITTHAADQGVLPADIPTYDLFAVGEAGASLVIQEYGTTTMPSLNWTFPGLTTEDDALFRAKIQTRPVVMLRRDGEIRQLGEVFDPAAFEQAAYSGYVSAGFAMSDGYFGPIGTESWIDSFRRSPGLDEPEQQHLAPALEAYKATLAAT